MDNIDNKYIDTFQVCQDVTGIRNLKVEKLLLYWDQSYE